MLQQIFLFKVFVNGFAIPCMGFEKKAHAMNAISLLLMPEVVKGKLGKNWHTEGKQPAHLGILH